MGRIGIIGGGQLAGMMAGVADRLDLQLVVQTPDRHDPAVSLAADVVIAAIDDAAATATLAQTCAVVTFENEFVDLAALAPLAQAGVCFRPALATLEPLLDKYDQRCYLRDRGLPTPAFAVLDPRAPLPNLPAVLKTRRHGYDGYGTCIVHTAAEWQTAVAQLGDRSLLVEAFVPFERELAVIAARSVTGEVVVYPIVETQQENQVCRRVFAPASVSPAVAAQARAIAQQLMRDLGAVGVFGIELFLTSDDRVLVNEIAPRVHNSGHFTLDACATSQFEQHLRAIVGLPLGDPGMHSPAAVMVNLLGFETSHSDYALQRQQLAQIPQSRVHWYGKVAARPGRKLGHVTVLLQDASCAAEVAQQIEAIWYGTP